MLIETGKDAESILFNLQVFLFRFFLQAEGYVKKTHYLRHDRLNFY